MRTALHIRTHVLPGKKVEFTVPELQEGEAVEVFIVRPEPVKNAGRSAIEIIESLHGHRLFPDSKDVDDYIQNERNSWDR